MEFLFSLQWSHVHQPGSEVGGSAKLRKPEQNGGKEQAMATPYRILSRSSDNHVSVTDLNTVNDPGCGTKFSLFPFYINI